MGRTRDQAASNGRVETGERGTASASEHTLFVYGDERQPTLRELDRMISFDSWAKSVDGAITWPIRSGRWRIQPAEGDRGEAAEVERQLRPKVGGRLVAGMSTAVSRRIRCAELIWETQDRDGKPVPSDSPAASVVALKDVAFRDVEQCEPERDDHGRIKGFRQQAWTMRRSVDDLFLFEDRKAFVYVHDDAARPGVGVSALDTAYQDHVNKKKLRFYRNKSLEKFGGPTTHIKTGAQPGTQAWIDAEDVASKARSGGAITTDKETELAYLTTPNPGVAFRQAIQDHNFEMAVSAYVQFLAMAQEGNSGAYALSRDHSDFLTLVTEGRMAEMAQAATDGPVRDIVVLNFGEGAAFPTWEFEPFSQHESRAIVAAAETLFGKLGEPMPDWLKNMITEGYAKSLGFEKPADADDEADADADEADDPDARGDDTQDRPGRGGDPARPRDGGDDR